MTSTPSASTAALLAVPVVASPEAVDRRPDAGDARRDPGVLRIADSGPQAIADALASVPVGLVR